MTKSDFLTILSIQSDRLKSEHARPGWSLWALLGALSSICWITLELHSTDKIEYNNSVLILLAVLMIEPLIPFIQGQLKWGNPQGSNRYKNISIELQASLMSFMYKLFVYFFIYVVCNYFFQFDKIEITILNVYVIFAILAYILMIVLSRFVILAKENSNSSKGLNLFIIISMLVLLCSSAYVIISKITALNVIIVQSAMLFTGIYLILKKSIEYSQSNPLLDSLDLLIDQVTFDQLTTDEAEQQLYMIINGIGFSQIFAPLFQEYQQADKGYHEQINSATSRLEKLKKETDEENKEILADASIKGIERLNIQMELVNSLKKKIDLKIAFYSISENNSDEYQKVKERFNELDKMRNLEVAKLNELIKDAWGEKGGLI